MKSEWSYMIFVQIVQSTQSMEDLWSSHWSTHVIPRQRGGRLDLVNRARPGLRWDLGSFNLDFQPRNVPQKESERHVTDVTGTLDSLDFTHDCTILHCSIYFYINIFNILCICLFLAPWRGWLYHSSFHAEVHPGSCSISSFSRCSKSWRLFQICK